MTLPKPFYEHAGITIYHGDCREILPTLPPVDLVLTDPPYGIGAGSSSFKNGTSKSDFHTGNWDVVLSQSEINTILASGEKSICWGGNYYQFNPSKCWLVWDKETGANSYADCELAYTNFDKPVKKFSRQWVGANAHDREFIRCHPTEKPVDLMRWCISIADPVETILDPFMGSGTTLRAAKDLGRKAIGIEIEERYCEIAAKRLSQEVFDFDTKGAA